ncbi:transposable element Tcb2 transposase [Trichonephila clavipes]|nr:transposable element Tcb2 transposase [Trichonephila clavipes]
MDLNVVARPSKMNHVKDGQESHSPGNYKKMHHIMLDDRRVKIWHLQISSVLKLEGICFQKSISRQNEEVERAVGPSLNGLPGAIFQQDNARPHTARVAQNFLRHFQTFPWAARSPDLSPVEHVWCQLKRQMPSCHSVHDLELAVEDLWARLPQDNIRCLINSMPDRVAACIAAGGGLTRY